MVVLAAGGWGFGLLLTGDGAAVGADWFLSRCHGVSRSKSTPFFLGGFLSVTLGDAVVVDTSTNSSSVSDSESFRMLSKSSPSGKAMVGTPNFKD